MKRTNHNSNRNIQVIILLVIPLMLIILGSLGYAAWTDQITTTAELEAAEYNIEIINVWIQHYNGLGCQLLWEEGGKDISFTDEALFPGWNLTLISQIHNKAITESWVATVNYTLYYEDPQTGNWIECTEQDLYALFRIKYTGAFYLDPGPDQTWDTPDDTPMPPDYQWIPCTQIYNKQNLYFDAQDRPDLAGTSFSIRVAIIATYPQEE
ncbi:MAG: hypothetical protein QXN36_00305 [Candidatus Bathyarchaeia archaeon]